MASVPLWKLDPSPLKLWRHEDLAYALRDREAAQAELPTYYTDEFYSKVTAELIERRDSSRMIADRLYKEGKVDEAFPVAQAYHRICKTVGYPADV